jgi:hypothetical protein
MSMDVHGTRKCMMSLRSALYSVLQRKFIVVLATLIVFGVLGTGSLFLESGKAEAAFSTAGQRQSTTVNLSYATQQQSPDTSSVASMIDEVFGPYAPAAQQVAQCESGMNPYAYNPVSINGSHAEGVFQILYPSTWYTTSEAWASPYDAMSNIRAAYEIFVRDGYSWREWAC